jgi:hypothetical protein
MFLCQQTYTNGLTCISRLSVLLLTLLAILETKLLNGGRQPANGPLLNLVALQRLAPNRGKPTTYSDEECGVSGVGPFFDTTINHGVSVAVG